MGLSVNISKNLTQFQLNINFDIGNERLAIIGESGSGKSMTLKSIAGIIKPDNGKILLNEKEIYNSDKSINLSIQDRKVGFLFQNYALFPHLNVLDNVTIAMSQKENSKQKAKEILSMFHVEHLSSSYPMQISGGEQQRVALARIFAIEPEILLLDEPFSALDTNLKWEIENDLNIFLKEYQKPIVMVTHDMNEAMRMCDKVLLISKGNIISFGTKEQVLLNPCTIEGAKLMGYHNIFPIELFQEIKIEGYNYVSFDSQKFKMNQQIDCLAFSVKHMYSTWDSENFLSIFEIKKGKYIKIEYKDKSLDLRHSKIFYYPFKDIIFLR